MGTVPIIRATIPGRLAVLVCFSAFVVLKMTASVLLAVALTAGQGEQDQRPSQSCGPNPNYFSGFSARPEKTSKSIRSDR